MHSDMKTKAKTYAVITCDIVGSRHIEEFRRRRDQKLHHISKLHVAKKWILSEYAITAWDEFEGILSRATNIPAVISVSYTHLDVYKRQLR